jgi:hypothetical protein
MARTNAQGNKAFDVSYRSTPAFYPDQIRIVGGADLADKRERGPLDTSADDVWRVVDGQDVLWSAHPLYNRERLEQPLKAGFVETIDLVGLITPIAIVKLDDHATVNVGRGRTRGSRIVNFERKKKCGQLGKSDEEAAEACAAKGFPLIKLDCVHKQVSDEADLLSRMFIENAQRQDDPLWTTIEVAARLLDKYNDLDMAAKICGQTPQTIKFWMTFRTVATDATVKAAKEGRLPLTAAAVLAREKDPEKQNELLAKLLEGAATGRGVVRKALTMVRKDKGSGANPFQGKAALVKFSTYLTESTKKKKLRGDFYAGVAAMIELQTTGKSRDERLAKLFKEFEG